MNRYHGEIWLQHSPHILHHDLPLLRLLVNNSFMSMETDSLVVLVDQVYEDIREFLVLVKFDRKAIVAIPSHKSKFVFYLLSNRPLILIPSNSYVHRIIVELGWQIHANLKINLNPIVNKGSWPSHGEIIFIFFRMFGVFLHRVVPLLDRCLDKYTAYIVGSVVRIYRVFPFLFVALADSLRAIEVYPLLFVVPTCFVIVLDCLVVWWFVLFQQFGDAEVAAPEDFLGLEDIGVDQSKDDVVNWCGQVDWYLYLLVPLGVAVSDDGLSTGVDHAELDSDIGIDCLPVDWLNVLALKNINRQLITFPLQVGGHHDTGVFLDRAQWLHLQRNPLVFLGYHRNDDLD